MKYFKIVNPKGHHGVIYHEGLNVDPIPFNTKCDCLPGGIHFASRDILAFLGFGDDVYEVEPVGEVYESRTSIQKFKAPALNMRYIGKWTEVGVIEYMIENGADTSRFKFINGRLVTPQSTKT